MIEHQHECPDCGRTVNTFVNRRGCPSAACDETWSAEAPLVIDGLFDVFDRGRRIET